MSNKKLLVFSADWCLPCRFSYFIWRQMAEEGFAIEVIDGDKEVDLRDRLGVDKYPTFILFENNEAQVTLIGKQDKETLIGLFDENRDVSLSEPRSC